MTKMTGSSSDHGLSGTNIALCEGISPSPLKAIESSNIVFILAVIFLCACFLRVYLSKLLSSYHLKQHSDHRTTKLAVSSSSEHGLNGCKYDVFISFRGTDTRKKFVSHLYKELCGKKVEAYKDDEKLPKGGDISTTLLEAIESSKISIVVLSENYATSPWCLEELVHILNCKREKGQIVLPVFYGVNPSAVRNQKESFASAFVKHEKRFKDHMEKVRKWRFALEEIGNLSGWDSNENQLESELVDKIARDILSKLQKLSSTFGKEVFRNLVGMEKRFNNFELLLRIDSPDVRVIGIWGMGGIGKSTLAEIVLNQLWYRFDRCFCEDVSNNEVKRHGLPNIKKKLYASLLNENDVNMNNLFNDVRLRRARVLVILDNVDDEVQLEKLIGVSEETKTRFGEGSRIIIASRDKKLLTERADEIYEVHVLDSYEANELFIQNAFGRHSSKRIDYRDLSKRIVDYAGGIPLALKVLGSYLRSRPLEEWKSALSELMKSPNKKVQEVLKISYDALDLAKQSIFLGIACLLKGEDRKLVEDILGDDSHIAISVLIERSLITIVRGKIWLHDLIQEMAREVVRQESVVLGERSWLWDTEDVYSVLKRNKGSARVKGMCLDLSKISNDLCLRSTVFEALENLIFLKIYGRLKDQKLLYFDEGLDYLPDSLRYLHWKEYPLKSLPSAFEPQNLVKLKMSPSKLEKLWNGVQHLGNLKHIDLSYSKYLIELPDLSQAPRLERVKLVWCKRLCRFPKISSNLQYLNMQYTRVEVFDPSLESAENLEFMYLGNCKRLTSLRMLPRSVKKLNLFYCKTLFVSAWPVLLGLHSLTKLTMSRCGISHIPESFNLLSSLETLDMGQNDFERIPSSIKQVNKLKHLCISLCKNLESLPDLPSSLKSLEAMGCESLRMISVCGLASLEWIDASECKSLEEFIIDEHACTSLEEFGIDETSGIKFDFGNCLKLKKGSQDNICTLFQRQMLGIQTAFPLERLHEEFSGANNNRACYCGNEIPKWFTSIHNISLGHNVIGISVSVVSELEDPEILYHRALPHLRIWSGAIKLMDCRLPPVSLYYLNGEILSPHVYMWNFYFNNVEMELLDSVTEASFEFKLTDSNSRAKFKIKKMGIRLIYLEEVEECNFSWQKADQTSPKPDEAPYSQRFKRKREEYGTDADKGATTSSPADAEETSSIREPHPQLPVPARRPRRSLRLRRRSPLQAPIRSLRLLCLWYERTRVRNLNFSQFGFDLVTFSVQFESAAGKVLANLKTKVFPEDVQILLISKEDWVSLRLIRVGI